MTDEEVERLLAILDNLRKDGVSCIYISHKLNEVFRIADTITVLRDGQSVSTTPVSDIDEDTVISLMVGRELTEQFPSVRHTVQEDVLIVDDLTVYDPENPTKEVVKGVSFTARKGEILGIAGLMGAGRTELAMALFGAYPGKWTGSLTLDGRKIQFSTLMTPSVTGWPSCRKTESVLGSFWIST